MQACRADSDKHDGVRYGCTALRTTLTCVPVIPGNEHKQRLAAVQFWLGLDAAMLAKLLPLTTIAYSAATSVSELAS